MRNHKSLWYVNLSSVIVILMLCAGCGGGGGSGGAVAAEEAAPDWESVSAGADHTLAVKTDGTLWAWGYNEYGQLGVGTRDDSDVPIHVGSDTDWDAVSVGYHHSLALKTDGSLWAWGFNWSGQLGYETGDDDYSLVPIQVGSE